MNAQEIAETLVNGNIAQARMHLLEAPTRYEAMVLALDVVEVLAQSYTWGEYPGDDTEPYQIAINKVRRCLEGAP